MALRRALPDPPAPRPRAATNTAPWPGALAGADRGTRMRRTGSQDAVKQDHNVNHAPDRREDHAIATYSDQLIDPRPRASMPLDRTPCMAMAALRVRRPPHRRRRAGPRSRTRERRPLVPTRRRASPHGALDQMTPTDDRVIPAPKARVARPINVKITPTRTTRSCINRGKCAWCGPLARVDDADKLGARPGCRFGFSGDNRGAPAPASGEKRRCAPTSGPRLAFAPAEASGSRSRGCLCPARGSAVPVSALRSLPLGAKCGSVDGRIRAGRECSVCVVGAARLGSRGLPLWVGRLLDGRKRLG